MKQYYNQNEQQKATYSHYPIFISGISFRAKKREKKFNDLDEYEPVEGRLSV